MRTLVTWRVSAVNFSALIAILLIGAFSVGAADDLSKLSKTELTELLAHPNSWQRRQAQRILSETLTARDKDVIEKLAALAGAKSRKMKPAPSVETRIAALGVLHATGTLTEKTLDESAADARVEIRLWSARFTGERKDANKAAMKRLLKLAADADVTVRASVAEALRQFTSGSLTVD